MTLQEFRSKGYIKQPRTLDEYLRQQRITEEAEKAAKESVQKILGHINKELRGEHENSSVHNQRSL